MTENIFQYIWKFQLYNAQSLATISGESLKIQFAGNWNNDQGPDFKDARIIIDGTLLAGSIELHIKTSDWNKHGHDTDKNYNNVILHVVFVHDDAILQQSLPTLILEDRIPQHLIAKLDGLTQNATSVLCGSQINSLSSLVIQQWLSAVYVERLSQKSTAIEMLLQQYQHDWDRVSWILLARSFGGPVNADAFQQMASQIPLELLSRHRHQIHQLEALLMGQAGLLQKTFLEHYPKMLQREYEYLKMKYGLPETMIPAVFLRMRPENFPTVRLAQLANLLQRQDRYFSKIKSAINLQELQELFEAVANDYWNDHFNFDHPTGFKIKKLGNSMMHHLIINLVGPLLFAYGLWSRDRSYCQKAMELMESVPAESNKYTRNFKRFGLEPNNALESQAMKTLHLNYCEQHKCLECAIGHAILKKDSLG